MRRVVTAIAAAATIASTSPAEAQYSSSSSSSAGFYYNGFIGMDYLRDGSFSGRAALIDMTFGFHPMSYGSFPGIGFQFGFWGYHQNFGFSSNEWTAYAALTFALGGGLLHVGAPRSAVYGIVDTPIPTGARAGLLTLGIYNGLLAYSTLLAVQSGNPMLGLMYERQAGALRYAVSYGQIRNAGSSINVLGLGGERQVGDTRLFGALERLWDGSNAITIATLGGSTRIGGGVSSLRTLEVGGNLTVTDSGFSTTTAATIYGTSALTERLDVTASLLHLQSGGSSQTIYGLNAAYDVYRGVHLNAGVGRATGGGATLWTLGFFRNF